MVIRRDRGRWLPGHVAALAAVMWLSQFAARGAPAVEAPGDTVDTTATAEHHSAGAPGAAEPLAKNQALMFAFVLLGCIIVGGAMLLALVVIWGNRARRMAQSPLPPVAKRNELWFLKPKKEAADGTGGAPSDPDQESNRET
jgi:hypothetical protein